jgi:stearoyl-CoA desaturase (delta-9 desaturase)
MGEGWHNNHHAYQSSVRQGFRWWEVDMTFYILKALSLLGIVWNLKAPPEQVRRNEHRLGARVINRAAEDLVKRFNPERMALAITSAMHSSELSALREAINKANCHGADALPAVHLNRMPTRNELLDRAQAMFARTHSLDEIVDRAYHLLLESVGSHLAASLLRSQTS